jgi:hypothetical protein
VDRKQGRAGRHARQQHDQQDGSGHQKRSGRSSATTKYRNSPIATIRPTI